MAGWEQLHTLQINREKRAKKETELLERGFRPPPVGSFYWVPPEPQQEAPPEPQQEAQVQEQEQEKETKQEEAQDQEQEQAHAHLSSKEQRLLIRALAGFVQAESADNIEIATQMAIAAILAKRGAASSSSSSNPSS